MVWKRTVRVNVHAVVREESVYLSELAAVDDFLHLVRDRLESGPHGSVVSDHRDEVSPIVSDTETLVTAADRETTNRRSSEDSDDADPKVRRKNQQPTP